MARASGSTPGRSWCSNPTPPNDSREVRQPVNETKKRLLFLAHRVPYPPDKGERVRGYHELRKLAEGFRVTLVAFARAEEERTAAEALRHWCEKIVLVPSAGRPGPLKILGAITRGRSLTQAMFQEPNVERMLREQPEPFDLAVGYSSGVLPLLLACPAHARVMDLVDVDSAKWDQYADEAHGPARWLYRREARAVRALEHMAVEQCDAVLVVSEAERRVLGGATEKVFVVGNGVDLEYFHPANGQPPAAEPPSLVFTGTMDYRPNVEAVCWFTREVWPALRREHPDLRFVIVGRDPVRAVRRLACFPGITVTGAVPDVRPYLWAARAAVVPLHIARGVQNKILEAMACGRAVVASPQALEGLDIVIGTHALRADSPAEWRSFLCELLSRAPVHANLGHQARLQVEARYSWLQQGHELLAICRRIETAVRPTGGCQSPSGRVLLEPTCARGAP